MKLRSIALLALCLAQPAAAKAPDNTTLAAIDRMFADWRLSAHAPGLVYGIVDDGKLVAVRGLGQALDPVDDLAPGVFVVEAAAERAWATASAS